MLFYSSENKLIDKRGQNKMRLRLIILLVIIFISIGDINKNNSNNSTTYRSLVNEYNGFYDVIKEDTGGPSQYKNYTLNISVGDKIIWINKDPTEAVAIISDQGLWENNSAILRYTRIEFNYTFDSPGIYTFHLDRYTKLAQKIIVSSNEIGSTVNATNQVITPNVTVTVTEPVSTPNVTVTVTEPVSTPSVTVTVDKVYNKNDLILLPLDILGNLKLTGIITFVIIVITSFIKDIIRKNGEGT